MTASLILVGYLIGSIPFAFLLTRRMGVDLRLAGSGNVGAANVFRTSGSSLGVATAVLDLAKGLAAVLLAAGLGADVTLRTATAIAAVVGHIYPVWLRFRGGKGVATACGAFGLLAPLATGAAILVFVATLWITRYVSLASILATALLGPLAYLSGAHQSVVAGILGTAVLVLFRHRANLSRLQAGSERRFGERV